MTTLLIALQQAASDMDTNFRHLKDTGDISYQMKIADDLRTIYNVLRAAFTTPCRYPDLLARGNGFPYVKEENAQARALLDQRGVAQPLFGYLRALDAAITTIASSSVQVSADNWQDIDATIDGLADCCDGLLDPEIAAKLYECALIVGQLTQGRKSMDVFQTRMKLSQEYLQSYRSTKQIDMLAQAARHAVIAKEMTSQVFQPEIDIQVVSIYAQEAWLNLEKVVRAAPPETPVGLFWLPTLTSTNAAEQKRQLEHDGKPCIE